MKRKEKKRKRILDSDLLLRSTCLVSISSFFFLSGLHCAARGVEVGTFPLSLLFFYILSLLFEAERIVV